MSISTIKNFYDYLLDFGIQYFNESSYSKQEVESHLLRTICEYIIDKDELKKNLVENEINQMNFLDGKIESKIKPPENYITAKEFERKYGIISQGTITDFFFKKTAPKNCYFYSSKKINGYHFFLDEQKFFDFLMKKVRYFNKVKRGGYKAALENLIENSSNKKVRNLLKKESKNV